MNPNKNMLRETKHFFVILNARIVSVVYLFWFGVIDVHHVHIMIDNLISHLLVVVDVFEFCDPP